MAMICFCHVLVLTILSVSANSPANNHNSTSSTFDPCLLNNGDCEQNCSKLEAGNGNVTAQCSCIPGFQLNKDLKSCKNGTETVTSVQNWLKIIGIDSAEVVLFLCSIFFGGLVFVYVITKLCFKKKKSPEYTLLNEKETTAESTD